MTTKIAFAGYAGSGKDEAAKQLIGMGFQRRCFGDLIKQDCDALIREHFGFSAFTEERDQKKLIRRTLEAWGDDNYDHLMYRFFNTLPALVVNTRLVRVPEAKEWRNRGGVIVLIERPGNPPASIWEADALQSLFEAEVIDGTLHNDGTVAQLHALTSQLPHFGLSIPIGHAKDVIL